MEDTNEKWLHKDLTKIEEAQLSNYPKATKLRDKTAYWYRKF